MGFNMTGNSAITDKLLEVIMADARANGIENPNIQLYAPPGYSSVTYGTDKEPPSPERAPQKAMTATGSTSSRTTTRKSISDPAAMDMFTASVMSAIQEGGTLDQSANAIIEGGKLRNDAAATLATAVKQKALAAGGEAVAKATLEATAALRKANILNGMNLNPDATENEALKAASVVNQTDVELVAMKQEIDERRAVGLFDNPIQFLINDTILPGLIQRYNNVVGTQNAAIDKYKTLSNLASSQQQISTAIDADLIQKAGVQTAAKHAADANADLARVQLENSAAATRDMLSLSQLSMSKAQLAGQLVASTRESQTVTDGLSAKDAAKAAEDQQLADVNKILVAAGANPLASLKGVGAKEKDILLSNVTSGKFGKDFAESFAFVKNSGDINTIATKGSAAVRTWYNGTLGVVGEAVRMQEAAATTGINAGKRFNGLEATLNQLNAMQALYEKEAATDMRVASKFNPLKLAYVTVAKLPELANNQVAAYINAYGPKSEKPRFTQVEEQYLMQRFTDAVAAGRMTMPDAVKAVTEFYKVGTAAQALQTHYSLFGMSKPEKGYVVTLPALGVNRAVDLTNPAQVENLFTVKIATDARVASAGILYGRGNAMQSRQAIDNAAALREKQQKLANSIENP